MNHTLNTHIEVRINGQWEHLTGRYIKNQDLALILTGQIGRRVEKFIYDGSVVTCTELRENRADGNVKDITILSCRQIKQAQELYRKKYARANPDRNEDEIYLESSFELGVYGVYIGGGAITSHRGYDDVRIISWLI